MTASSASRRHVLAAGLLSLGLTVGLLTLLELGLRAAGLGPPPPFKLHPQLRDQASLAVVDIDLLYRLRPGSILLGRYRINSLGYRGPDVARERTRGTLRVVCTGDSSTFGLGLNEEQAWPFVLGRLLGAALGGTTDPMRVEIINAGVPGYTTLQNRDQIVRDLLPLHPDALVWCPMGHNDDARTQPPDELARLAARRSLAGRLQQLAVVHRLGWLLESQPPRDAGTVPRVSLPTLEENLRVVAVAAREARVPLVLVAPPHDARTRVTRPGELAAEEVVVRVARETGVALADPRAELDALGARELFPDGVHPATEAQVVIAWHAFVALVQVHPELLAPRNGPQSSASEPGAPVDFPRAWVRATEDALASLGTVIEVGGAPPSLLAALEALRRVPDPLAPPPPGAPESLQAHDPLHGTAASRDRDGALRLLAARAAAQGEARRAEELVARAEESARHLRPRDPLLLLLAPYGTTPDERALAAERSIAEQKVDPDKLRLARALLAWQATLADWPAPVDDRMLATR